MTAFYMCRLMGKTFYGQPSAYVRRIWDRIHESTWTMTVPLVLLAIPSALLGIFLGLPLGDSPDHPLAGAGLRRVGGDAHPDKPPYELFGIDGALILIERRHRDHRPRRRDLALRRLPAGRQAGARSPPSRTPTARRASCTGPP